MTSLTGQYILTGAGLGLYFGWFFRPVREPSLVLVLVLSLTFALISVVYKLIRKRPFAPSLPAEFGRSFFRLAIALTVLDGRHPVYDWGGRPAVIFYTTILGALVGWWWATNAPKSESEI